MFPELAHQTAGPAPPYGGYGSISGLVLFWTLVFLLGVVGLWADGRRTRPPESNQHGDNSMKKPVNIRVGTGPAVAEGLDADEALQKAHDLVKPGRSVTIYDPVGGWTLARVHADGSVDVVGVVGRRVYPEQGDES